MAFCQVIVDIAHEDVDRVFTYRVPEGMALCPGMRVHVPFGRMKRVEGVVVEMAEACDLPPERVRDVADTLEDYPAVLPQLLTLAVKIRQNAFCTLAQALRLMFPAQMRGAQVLAALFASESGEIAVDELRAKLGECRQPLQALCKMGFVQLQERETLRKPYGAMERLAQQDPQLTRQQEDVLATLLPAVEAGATGANRDRSGARDCAHAADGHVVPLQIRGRCGRAAFQAFPRGAL